jgi:hypothetical protein
MVRDRADRGLGISEFAMNDETNDRFDRAIEQAKRDLKTALSMLDKNPERVPAAIEMIKLAIAELKAGHAP